MGQVRFGFVAVLGLFAGALAGPAQGQLVGLNHLWTVPGVMNTSSGVGTFIACSNVGTIPATIGVDIYGPGGSYVSPLGTNSIPVAPGSTVVFGTSSAVGISVDVNYGSGLFSKGRAEISATTTKGVLCSAYLADIVNGIPTSFATLTIAKKTKQKGD